MQAAGAPLPLTILGKVDKVNRAHYKTTIERLLENPPVEFIGKDGGRLSAMRWHGSLRSIGPSRSAAC